MELIELTAKHTQQEWEFLFVQKHEMLNNKLQFNVTI